MTNDNQLEYVLARMPPPSNNKAIAEIAARAGIPRQTLYKIVRGDVPNPRYGTVYAVYRFLRATEKEARGQS